MEQTTLTLDFTGLRVFVSKAIHAVKVYDDKFGKSGEPAGEAGAGTYEEGELQAYLAGLETLTGINCVAMAMTVRDVIKAHDSGRARTYDLCRRLKFTPTTSS